MQKSRLAGMAHEAETNMPSERGLRGDRRFDELLTAAHECQQTVLANGTPTGH